jgi:hypothetical protein
MVIALLLMSLQASVSYAAPPPPDRGSEDLGRQIQFAGIIWGVRDGWGSPGPNEFSDATDSVWVDEQGRLHLKVRKWQGKWYAAEIFSTVKTRYGLHSFSVFKENPTLDAIDPNLVLGLFLYKAGCGPDCHAELDIEFSRWRKAGVYRNAQYVAQPAEVYKNKFPFNLSNLDPLSTHYIDWQDEQVVFSSYVGGGTTAQDNLLQKWTYKGEDIPHVSENVLVVIDYWLDRGVPPRYGKDDEVIIEDLEIPMVCIPQKQLYCEETVTGRTDAPGSRHQVDTYAGWPLLEKGPEYAYRFTAPTSGNVAVSLTNHKNNQDIFVVAASAVPCSSNYTIASGDEAASFEMITGQTYYVIVDGQTETGGGYSLTLDCSGKPLNLDPLFGPAKK